ncbi:MAG: hypothetical protein ACI3XR_09605 [Eubacteriales bacterium]
MNIQPLSLEDSSFYRNILIDSFICATTEEYRRYILSLTEVNGLPYYSGCLWDYLDRSNSVSISERDALEYLLNRNRMLLMFDPVRPDKRGVSSLYAPPFDRPDWSHRVYSFQSENMNWINAIKWEYNNKRPVIKNHSISLPNPDLEDFYFFDEEMIWFVVLTQETKDSRGRRLCFCSKNML